MERVDVGGFSLRVDRAGSGDPAWVCLHGLVDRLEIWDRCFPSFADRGRAIRFDQRGHGDSGAPAGPFRREDLAGDVVALLDRFEIPRAILVGHSMGGIVSMTTALAHPERVAGLVLVGTASQCSEKVAAWYERIALAGERDGTAGLARAIYGRGPKRAVSGDAAAIARVTRTLTSLFDDPLTPKLSELACPALLVVGENDPMGPKASQIIVDALPAAGATLEVVPACGHWVHVEKSRALMQAVDAWRWNLQSDHSDQPDHSDREDPGVGSAERGD